MKMAIVYASQTGNTEAAAEFIEDGILEKCPFMEVRTMNVRDDEVDVKYLEECDGIIFGSPVYFTSMSWELKRWFDNSFRINLKGKVGAVFVTAQSPTGGTDTTIMEILRHMLAKGMLVCSGMSSKGASKFQIGAIALARDLDAAQEELEEFGVGVAENTLRMSGKL